MWIFDFWTKKKKENFYQNKGQVRDAYDRALPEQQEKIRQNAINTQDQNFSAYEYNEQARQNWEQNWQTAYRRDILWINDEEKVQKFSQNENNNLNFQDTEKSIEQNENIIKPAENNIQKIENDSRVSVSENSENFWPQNINSNISQNQNTIENKQAEKETLKTENNTQKDIFSQKTQENNLQNPQKIDWQSWNVEDWKKRWSSKEELENAVENKYSTVATYNEKWNLEAIINGEKFEWKLDSHWNPQKISLWKVGQEEQNKSYFMNMIQTGVNTKDLNEYIYKNNLQDDPVIKKQMEQKYLDDFEKPILQKYSSYSIKDLYKAVQNWELIPWTELFNKLPQAEAYNKAKSSLAIINADKDKDYTAYNASLDIQKTWEKLAEDFFDTTSANKILDNYKKDPDVKKHYDDIQRNQEKMVNLRKQLKDIEDITRNRMSWVPESVVQAEITRQSESILREIEVQEGMMNSSASMIDLKKKDLQLEMSVLQYTDSQKKSKYMASLDLYKYERWRMDRKEEMLFAEEAKGKAFEKNKAWELEKMEFQVKNQEIAFSRQQKAQKEMFELQQKYKWWTYQIWADWSLNYIVNWQAQRVKFDNWETLFTKNKEDGWNYKMDKNKDWTWTRVWINKNWKVNIENFDIDWNKIWWIPDRMYEAIDSIWDWHQCWAWVNKFLKSMWIKWNTFWNEYSQKQSKIDAREPAIWAIAVYNPSQIWSENYKYWHVAIVTWIDPDGKHVYVTDWNWDWKSEKKTENKKVPLSTILANNWGFHYPKYPWVRTSEQLLDNSKNSWNKNLNWALNANWFSNKALSWAEDLWKWLVTMKDIPSKSRDEVQEAKKFLEKQWFFKLKEDDEQSIRLKSKIDLIDDMLKKDWDLNSLSWKWQMNYWFESWKNDMINNIESLLSNDVLKTLIDAKANWASFGALSNAELDMLRAAADRLWTWAIRNEKTQRITWFNKSEKQLKDDLTNFKDKYIRAYKKATWIDLWNPAWL